MTTEAARAAVTLVIPGDTSRAVEETLVTIPETRAVATLGTNLGVMTAIARAETATSLAEEAVAAAVAAAAGRAGNSAMSSSSLTPVAIHLILQP